MKKVFWLALLATTSFASNAFALTTLKGKEAVERVGDPKAHFTGGNYTYEILKRSHRDSMHGRFSDAVVFNAGGGLFTYLRRKDGNHLLVLDAPDGREEEPVTEEVWKKELQNTLSDDNRDPIVFLDEKGQELAAVFVGRGTRVKGAIQKSGLLQIEIEVEGAKERSHRRGRQY